jgi:hypothetical protein
VRTRGELAARIFLEPNAAPLAADVGALDVATPPR